MILKKPIELRLFGILGAFGAAGDIILYIQGFLREGGNSPPSMRNPGTILTGPVWTKIWM